MVYLPGKAEGPSITRGQRFKLYISALDVGEKIFRGEKQTSRCNKCTEYRQTRSRKEEEGVRTQCAPTSDR